jgi:hypothetical protein
MNKIKIDRETKVILLNVLRKGYFTDNDVKFIANKTGLDITFLNLMMSATSYDDSNIVKIQQSDVEKC